jgi:predicted Zn-dependent protease with MMP-like domain
MMMLLQSSRAAKNGGGRDWLPRLPPCGGLAQPHDRRQGAVAMDAPVSHDWQDQPAPSLDDIEAIGQRAFAGLPAAFRTLTGEVLIRVADFPEPEVLEEMQAESDFDLLGLFQGVGLAHASAIPPSGQLPNMIWLYRRPILDYWAENEETLGAVVSHVLIHEIGHHFGLSDADMEAIEDAAG